jgi:hypothetical protein
VSRAPDLAGDRAQGAGAERQVAAMLECQADGLLLAMTLLLDNVLIGIEDVRQTVANTVVW